MQSRLQPEPAQYLDRGDLVEALKLAMLRNISIIGNCIGLTLDLPAALEAYDAGTLPVVMASVHEAGEVAPFLTRTYSAPDRFGKVVYRFAT